MKLYTSKMPVIGDLVHCISHLYDITWKVFEEQLEWSGQIARGEMGLLIGAKELKLASGAVKDIAFVFDGHAMKIGWCWLENVKCIK